MDLSNISTDSLSPLEQKLLSSVNELAERCRKQNEELKSLRKDVQYLANLLDQNGEVSA